MRHRPQRRLRRRLSDEELGTLLADLDPLATVDIDHVDRGEESERALAAIVATAAAERLPRVDRRVRSRPRLRYRAPVLVGVGLALVACVGFVVSATQPDVEADGVLAAQESQPASEAPAHSAPASSVVPPMTSSTSVASTATAVPSGDRAPQDDLTTEGSQLPPTTVPAVETSTQRAATLADEPCMAEGATVVEAREAYEDACSQPRVDCDQFDGGWRCSSEQIGHSSGP